MVKSFFSKLFVGLVWLLGFAGAYVGMTLIRMWLQ